MGALCVLWGGSNLSNSSHAPSPCARYFHGHVAAARCLIYAHILKPLLGSSLDCLGVGQSLCYAANHSSAHCPGYWPRGGATPHWQSARSSARLPLSGPMHADIMAMPLLLACSEDHDPAVISPPSPLIHCMPV